MNSGIIPCENFKQITLVQVATNLKRIFAINHVYVCKKEYVSLNYT